jgi:DNA-binding transcriptional LysR family regulator
MQDLNDLYYYVQVVKHRGFSAAARALNMPKSRLSRRIAQLEARIETQLINRSARQFCVTQIGQIYYQHCEAMLVEAEAAQDAIAILRTEPQGTIRLSCPTGLLNFYVAQMLPTYMKAHPKVHIHLESTDRHVDIIAERFDLAIRVSFTPPEDSSLVMKTLSSSPQQLVASPQLAAKYGGCILPGDLDTVPTLDWANHRREHMWCLEGPDGASATILHKPRLVTDDMVTLREAALAGIGVVQLPLLVIHQDLEAGRLVPVVPQWRPRAGMVNVIFPSRRGVLPAVRSFLDFLSSGFGKLDFSGPFAQGRADIPDDL